MTEIERYNWYEGEESLLSVVARLLPILKEVMDRAGIPDELRVPLAGLMVELAGFVPQSDESETESEQ